MTFSPEMLIQCRLWSVLESTVDEAQTGTNLGIQMLFSNALAILFFCIFVWKCKCCVINVVIQIMISNSVQCWVIPGTCTRHLSLCPHWWSRRNWWYDHADMDPLKLVLIWSRYLFIPCLFTIEPMRHTGDASYKMENNKLKIRIRKN